MAGKPDVPPVRQQYALTRSLKINGNRLRFKPAKIVAGQATGNLMVLPLSNKSSADIVSAGKCDGVVILDPTRGEYRSGETVEFHPWKRIL
jgi:molybdopterin biosynthesis enzyme